MLDAGQSNCSISAATGIHPFTISRLCSKERSELQKFTGGRSKKLSPSNTVSAMPSISSPLKGQKMLSRSPNPSPASSKNPSPQHHSSSPQKRWYEGCGQDQMPPPLCQTLQSMFELCPCSQGLDPGWLKEGGMVWWDQDQLPRVRWMQMGVEKARRGAEWQAGRGNSQVWRRVYHDLGVYDLGGSWVCCQDWWQDG